MNSSVPYHLPTTTAPETTTADLQVAEKAVKELRAQLDAKVGTWLWMGSFACLRGGVWGGQMNEFDFPQ